jgi:hypothetical protein
MKLFLRNLMSVLLLQPAEFVVPHPRVLRVMALLACTVTGGVLILTASPSLSWMIACAMLALGLRTAGWSKAYGHAPLARAIFAGACAATVAAGLSEMAGQFLVSSILALYVAAAVTVQMPAIPALESLNEAERQGARDARAAFEHGASLPRALTAAGLVCLREHGPTVAHWKGQPIFEWVIDAHGRRWTFVTTTGGNSGPTDDQLLLPPGAVYRQTPD